MVGLEEPGLSDEVLDQIAAQIAERIGEQMAHRLAQMTTRADELLQAIDAKLIDGASKTDQGGA
jgi:putative heme iron utilization protein